jgi:hypothetical protein
MSISVASVCNIALVECGADRISSIDESKHSAIVCKAVFEALRNEVLRSHPWNFAVKRATLSPSATTPDWGYDYQFDIPSDCLRVLNMDDETIIWEREGTVILSDEATLNVRYIYLVDDPSLWDSMFATCLGLRLGSAIAYALTQSSTLADALLKRYTMLLPLARSMDGAEGIMSRLTADEWTGARRNGGIPR